MLFLEIMLEYRITNRTKVEECLITKIEHNF